MYLLPVNQHLKNTNLCCVLQNTYLSANLDSPPLPCEDAWQEAVCVAREVCGAAAKEETKRAQNAREAQEGS